MKIVFMGTPVFAVNVLEKLIEKKYNVCLVVTQPDKKTGRGQKIVYSPIKKLAIKNNLKLIQPDNINDCVSTIAEMDADYIVTCAYGQFLSSEILKLAKIKALNVHASLLPKYRGGAPIHRAIMNGDEYTGVSIMEMIDKMDAGNIFIQEKIPINNEDNLETIHDKLSLLGSELLPRCLDELQNDIRLGVKQDEKEVTYSPIISKQERKINFNDKAINIYNKVRAFNPFPYAIIYYEDLIIKVHKVLITSKKSEKPVGEIILISKDGIEVSTDDYNIIIVELTISGKKTMDAKQFYNGNKEIKIGTKFK
ncbi:MAG: methionyl-tRNA formyltransferase [Bacilli bacterium]